jgi:hypothetical protein
MNNEFTLIELGDMLYALSCYTKKCEEEKSTYKGDFFEKQYTKAVALENKVRDMLTEKCNTMDEMLGIFKNAIDEEIEPEYDSAGFTEDDRIVNGQYRVVSNEEADADALDYIVSKEYFDSMNKAQAEDRKLGNI